MLEVHMAVTYMEHLCILWYAHGLNKLSINIIIIILLFTFFFSFFVLFELPAFQVGRTTYSTLLDRHSDVGAHHSRAPAVQPVGSMMFLLPFSIPWMSFAFRASLRVLLYLEKTSSNFCGTKDPSPSYVSESEPCLQRSMFLMRMGNRGLGILPVSTRFNAQESLKGI